MEIDLQSRMKSILCASVLAAAGIGVSASSASAALIVPGTADIWAWNGIAPWVDAKGTSTVADILPVLAISDLSGIFSVTITATGQTANCPGCFQINGAGPLISHTLGASNGLPNLTAPIDSLVGAWINPLNAAYDTPFEIGTGGTFIVPTGATRLYLGSMDAHEWNNNLGAFNVTLKVTRTPEPISLSLFGAGLAGAAAMRRRKR